MELEEIDWNALWMKKHLIRTISSKSDQQEERWDQMAPWYRLWSEHDEYYPKFLQKVKMDRDWSVLDIGCGTGIISIAAAIRSKQVTAIDISSQMLDILKDKADRRFFGNIRYLHQPWESIRLGSDIKSHDVVIASRAIARTGDLLESLQKINQATKRFAYVTAWGGEEGEFIHAFHQAIGRTDVETPDDIYVYNLLHRMKIYPNVEQLLCKNQILYDNPDQALESYRILLHLTPKETDIARDYLFTHLKRRKNGKYETPETRTRWSLFWWEKNHTEEPL